MFNPIEKKFDKFQKLRQTLNSPQQEDTGAEIQVPNPPQPIQQPQSMAAPKPITPTQPLQPTTPTQPQGRYLAARAATQPLQPTTPTQPQGRDLAARAATQPLQPTTPTQPQGRDLAAQAAKTALEQPRMIGPAQQEQEMKNQLMPQSMQPVASQEPSSPSLYTDLNKLPPPAQPPQQSPQLSQQPPQKTFGAKALNSSFREAVQARQAKKSSFKVKKRIKR